MVDDTSNLYWGASDDLIGECHADGTFTSDARVYFSEKQSLSSVTLTMTVKGTVEQPELVTHRLW